MIRTGTLLDLDMQSLGGLIARGWDWWTGELAGLLPTRRGGAGRAIAGPVLDWDTPGGFAQAAPGPATILIAPDLVLVRHADLPAAGARDLRRLVALDLDRLTPFGAEAAYFDIVVRGAGATPGTLAAAIAVIPRPLGRDIAERALAQGIDPRAIGVAAPDGRSLQFDFLPQLRADGIVPARVRGAVLWWGLVALLFAANLGVHVYRDVAATDRLRMLVDDQQATVAVARRVALSIAREEALRDALLAARARGNALAILATTARAVPSGAWVERLSWGETGLRLSGYKQPDIDIARALRQSGQLRAVRMTTADAATESGAGEPFDVTAQLAVAR